MNKKNFLFNALLSTTLFTFSYAGYGLNFLIWFSLIPLFHIISFSKKKFSSGLLSGAIIYTASVIWLAPTISKYGGIPYLLSFVPVILLGTYLGLFTAILSILFPDYPKKPFLSLFLVPCLWTGLDFCASFLFSGFPWVSPGYSQYKNTNLIQIASITGVYGLTYFIVMVNTGFFIILKRFAESKKLFKKDFAIMAVLGLSLSALLFYGHYNIENTKKIAAESSKTSLLLVQANILPDNKHGSDINNIVKKHFSLIEKNNEKYDIAIWPETAVPYPVFLNKKIKNRIIDFAKKNNNQLIGILDVKNIKEKYILKNRAVLFEKNGNTEKFYDKIHLVPFGEYIPLKKYFPFLALFITPSGEFSSGLQNYLINMDKIKIAAKICFEIIFPNLVRKQVKNGANIIINLTNDAWFGKTAGPYQHLSISVFRAVENMRSIARCANTGISAHILPTGEIISMGELFKEETLTKNLPLIEKQSIYTNYGDYFAKICLIVLLITGFFYFINFYRKKEKKNECRT
ncbi:MAG: apolipoprotein N-acyltransferase [Deltaproteobacteria bacterium]|nr:MAG: apolipoprotein N-acyltransferase [Deltaproteobacteria bacterium]